MYPVTPMSFDETTLLYLKELRTTYPSIDAALAKIAVLSSTLTLPKGTIHVISDVHGEYKKLRHVVNNASGSLRPLVSKLFSARLSDSEQLRLLSFIYYPRESFLHFCGSSIPAQDRRAIIIDTVRSMLEIIRSLAQDYPLHEVAEILPKEYIQVFRELILSPQFDRSPEHFAALVETFLSHGEELDLIRLTARIVRNLAIDELIVAGDLGDRGARIDKSIEFISQQPHVAMTWGNHDTTWMAACLGHSASIASVIRISLRYGRLSQLEEGYGIPLEPVAKLVAEHYADDPATRFSCKDTGDRDAQLLARMQKAMAVMQFKLEAQLIARNPHFSLHHRDLFSRIDHSRGSIAIDANTYPLLDTVFPTVDATNPTALNSAEQSCLAALTESFLSSPVLWRHMSYVAKKGRMHLIRDYALIFHGCVPCNEHGEFLELSIDGVPRKGKELFDAIAVAVQRAFQFKRCEDLDLLWYLWCGALSPLFGKDKIATFELYFIEDGTTHHEEKNPYFTLIHEEWFCQKVLNEFGVDHTNGLIVNGHVPVKIEKGESPLKRCGKAVTIDGAFSEAYGDKGYTLVLQPKQTFLALHHHFTSIDDAIQRGVDMIPEIQILASYPSPRLIGDTERGREICQEIALLELLMKAYRENRIEELRAA